MGSPFVVQGLLRVGVVALPIRRVVPAILARREIASVQGASTATAVIPSATIRAALAIGRGSVPTVVPTLGVLGPTIGVQPIEQSAPKRHLIESGFKFPIF